MSTYPAIVVLVVAFMVSGCIGPVALHQAVLGYDETVSRLEREMLLLNIARKHQQLPGHFTVTSSIAATFDYRANTGFVGNFLETPGINTYTFSFGTSAAENPTLSIVPIQGEDFTRRILTPMEESKFAFLVFQGVPIDMVMRLMADGIEVQSREGRFERFILNGPAKREEYAEFRRRALHFAWLNANRQLWVGTLSFQETIRAKLPGPPSAGDLLSGLEKGYHWRRVAEDGTYELVRSASGRVTITNYDPRGALSSDERRALNALAAANPDNFVLVDIRPGLPGGDFPIFGALKLRSLNVIIKFIADGISKNPEYDVDKDPRTGEVGRNPRRILGIELSDGILSGGAFGISFGGRRYSLADTSWDREAFTLLYQLFQMTVTDVSRVAVPTITIGK